MTKITFIPFMLIFIFFSCEKKSTKPVKVAKKEHKEIKNASKNAISPPIIDIQPFLGMDISELNYVHTELKKVFPVVILKEEI
jgi:hypothetical protein